ncbi:MAG: hypothetical protein KKA76_04375, partial [Proteobacteria bacterium]|nr:hypothetical protein [Pseudomonadota bacterium]
NNANEQYTLTCRGLPASVEVVIHEKGIPFQAELAHEYHPQEVESTGDTRGLGMYLLRHAVDEVKFLNLGRDGKETVLIKHLSHKRIDALLDSQQKVIETDAAALGPWHIRQFREEDALEISRCAWQTYGYTYEPYIYYPDMIIRMNREGRLRSLVAEDETGQLLGHAGLKFYHPEDPIAEIGVAFVKPICRRHGVFSALTNQAFTESSNSGLFGIYGRAVTSHILSQKKCMDSGSHPTGIFLGLFPSDVDFKNLGGRISQKESALLFYASLNRDEARCIYPPEKHKKIIEEIFFPLNCPICCEPAALNIEKEEADFSMETTKMEVFNSVDILCFSATPAMAPEIRSLLRRYCMEHVDILYLFINLEKSGAARLAELCEDMGFFFSGILPFGLRGQHSLILQYRNNLSLDYDAIQLYGPAAVRLKNYIEQHDPNMIQ